MADAGLVPLLMRMVVSLGVVLSIVAVAYLFARRRATRGVGGRSAARARRSGRRSAPQALEVVGRAGVGRSSALVAVRFGQRIVLVSAHEQGPATLVAEMDSEHWDEMHTVREELVPEGSTPFESAAAASRPQPPRRFLDALRDATTRHA